MSEIPAQLWCGTVEPVPAGFTPVGNMGWVKPAGGMWTADHDGAGSSPWLRWCQQEQYAPGLDPALQRWELVPDPAARVEVIGSLADLLALGYRYPARALDGRIVLDFEAMAADVDAVRLTEEGQWATRMSEPMNLYGWDMPSTLWLRWSFAPARRVGPPARRAAVPAPGARLGHGR